MVFLMVLIFFCGNLSQAGVEPGLLGWKSSFLPLLHPEKHLFKVHIVPKKVIICAIILAEKFLPIHHGQETIKHQKQSLY